MISRSQSSILWITRSQPFGLFIARQCGSEGIPAFSVPLLQVIPLAVSPPDDVPGAILFTSAQGVRTHRFEKRFRDVPVLTVGDATATEATAKGYSTVVSAGGNVDDLKRLAVTTLPTNDRIFLIGAREPAGDLEDCLRRRGYIVDRHIVYETRSSTDAELRYATDLLDRVHGICIYSPKGAERLSTLLATRRWSGSIYCLSHACANRISAGPDVKIEVAARPTGRSLHHVIRSEFEIS